MTLPILQSLWYLVIAASVLFYAMLDGFDLGVGILHLFAKKDRDRRIFLNAIGPVWDGNEVWLVVIVGALFAGFPDVYATVMTAFYTMTMLFLVGIIFRAVAIEFRSKQASRRWRCCWDISFCFASIIITFLLGVMLGNLIQGIPLNSDKEFIGGFFDLFSLYTLVIGVFALSLFTMHGCIYLIMKTTDELQALLRKWLKPLIIFFFATYLISTSMTFWKYPYMIDRIKEYPIALLLPLLTLFGIFSIPRYIAKHREGRAFIVSCLTIASLFTLFGIGSYPLLLRSSIDPITNSLTIADSSSAYTMRILLLIALIGVPLVLAYGIYVYHIFRGKVEITDTSY